MNFEYTIDELIRSIRSEKDDIKAEENYLLDDFCLSYEAIECHNNIKISKEKIKNYTVAIGFLRRNQVKEKNEKDS